MARNLAQGLTRRGMLQLGMLGISGLSLSELLRLEAAGAVDAPRVRSGIFVNLGGGPSHMDTFDLKPNAPPEYRGEFSPIATTVSGMEICEHLPNLSKKAGYFAILRGVSHSLAAHQLGSKYLNTGNRPIPSLEFPSYGAVVAKELPCELDLPPYVAIPTAPQSAGYLGIRHAALNTGGAPSKGKPFSVRGISLAGGMSVQQFERREQLLRKLDGSFSEAAEVDDLVSGLDQFDEQAFRMLSSPRTREAFDTGHEPDEVMERFGNHAFGQSCLLATRLVQAGVRFVTIQFSGWDTHKDNFKKLRSQNLPQLDQGLAGMFETLAERGLSESTTVMVTGEFGRTPKVNANAGRDHWPRAMSVLIGGGGVRGGQVIGSSDEKGQGPADRVITPDQVGASLYRALGIDFKKEYHTLTGRPVMIVRDGDAIPELFG